MGSRSEPEGRIFGRGNELAEIGRFLDRASSGASSGPSALRLEGEAGVGKTTLWAQALSEARARGWRVLSASAAEREGVLAFAVLGDLLGPALDEVVDGLAPPLRGALDVALLREGSPDLHPDRRAVGLAVTEAIRLLSGPARVLVAVDDVQWVDPPSAQALAFAVRRLRGSPVAIVTALRVGPGIGDALELERALPDADVQRLAVRPLDPSSLRRLLRMQAGPVITSELARRLHEASGGNPFFALELTRAVEREGFVPEPGEPLPLPNDLARLLRSRIASLSDEARDVLLLVAVAGHPTLDLIRRAADPGHATASLREAERAELIEVVHGRVRFTHPLLGSTVHAEAGPELGRSAHRRLSRVVDDPIERALHLALSIDGADREAASVLDEASQTAEDRGAPAVAAELSVLAHRLTPAEDAKAARERSLAAAELLFESGDGTRAMVWMEKIVAEAPPGAQRAEALHRQGHLEWNDVRRVRELIEWALREVDDDAPPILLVNLHRAMGWVELWSGDPRLAADHLDRAAALAESVGDTAELALCLNGQAYLAFFTGRPDALDLVRRAVLLTEPRGIDLDLAHPRRTLGTLQLWAGELEEARGELERDYREIVERGHFAMGWLSIPFLTELEIRAGHWERAERYASEGMDTTIDVGHEREREVALWSSALVAAHRGETDVAYDLAAEGLVLAERHEDLWYVISNGSVLGFLALSLGDAAGAHEHLAPLVELAERMGLQEPGIFPFLPDEIEALIALGELDGAETLLERLEGQARARDRALALACAARCRGLLAAARGDLVSAAEELEEALVHHARIPQPFDLGRTLLVQGQLLRRQKQKRSARATLERARETFERLGAPLWAEKARAELARIGGRAPSPTELTPTERRVAELVGRGMTNGEVAAALFVSESTIRANLKRIYVKLGIRSRTELAARLRDEGEPSDAQVS